MTATIVANPPAKYLGGKRNLARRLCALIETIPHRAYIEPFVGMGGVFLRRTKPAPVEVINDLSGDVANLFRIVRRHYQPFVDELAFLPASRDEFDRQRRLNPEVLTDIERAVRFLYLQRLCFGGMIEGRTFGVDRAASSRFNLAKIRANLRSLSRRLEPVTIEKLPYQDVIRRYDDARALFYLDPPYDKTEGYGVDFSRDDYLAMAEQLAGIKGQFIISINDTPFVRDAFARFSIEEIPTTWTLATRSAGAQKVNELLIRSETR
ncbi:DNA adenine methylase [Sphingomonas aerophila]|uniref:site-specific DNA-methyltransferase (adenine-specific) n=1 Tax=Sphingomonas aerophila TaxID=1344948 RepID=A0A7W9EUM0_9SPHN|nr:DNA adenine methylase [Sphingomonas aerophila]MBB5715414.1 DNA adenine methylase [Sphingomonas aerophila]